MTRDVETVAPDTPLAAIATLLEKRRIKRVPVLDEGRLVGIVSRSDLVHALVSAARAARRPTRSRMTPSARWCWPSCGARDGGARSFRG